MVVSLNCLSKQVYNVAFTIFKLYLNSSKFYYLINLVRWFIILIYLSNLLIFFLTESKRYITYDFVVYRISYKGKNIFNYSLSVNKFLDFRIFQLVSLSIL